MRISSRTREIVQKAILDLGYQPNASARSMRSKRFDAIGVCLAAQRLRQRGFTPGDFYLQILDGVESAISAADYLCVMCRTDLDQHAVPKFLRIRCVDALLAVHCLDPDTHAAAVGAKIPVLGVNAAPTGNMPSVNFDDEGSVRTALDRLWAIGHRRIGYVDTVGNSQHVSQSERLLAYNRWCSDHGVPAWVSRPFDLTTRQSAPDFLDWTRSLLAQPQAYTAIMFYDQGMFEDGLRFLNEASIGVPGQVSAVACGLTLVARINSEVVPFSGMEYDTFELGRLAGQTMTSFIQQGQPLQSRRLPGTWREGATIGPPATGTS
jgi:DNA-binding LacI/PurR family transcriptional regulator